VDAAAIGLLQKSFRDEKEKISQTSAAAFLETYLGLKLESFQEETAAKENLQKVLGPYLDPDGNVTRELEEIEALMKRARFYADQTAEELKVLRDNWKRIFRRQPIRKLTEELELLRLVHDELHQARIRRYRWSVDILIGDFYVVWLFLFILGWYAKEKQLPHLHFQVVRYATLLKNHVAYCASFYTYKERKEIQEYVLPLLEEAVEEAL